MAVFNAMVDIRVNYGTSMSLWYTTLFADRGYVGSTSSGRHRFYGKYGYILQPYISPQSPSTISTPKNGTNTGDILSLRLFHDNDTIVPEVPKIASFEMGTDTITQKIPQ